MGFVKFKIKPKGVTHYFVVFVFDTKKEMHDFKHEYDKIEGVTDGYGGFGAIVMPYTIENTKTGKIKNEIGTCLFYRDFIGAGPISHEMLHCAMWYERLLHGNKDACFGQNVGEDEERLCYTMTDLIRSFVNKMYKLGYYG